MSVEGGLFSVGDKTGIEAMVCFVFYGVTVDVALVRRWVSGHSACSCDEYLGAQILSLNDSFWMLELACFLC